MTRRFKLKYDKQEERQFVSVILDRDTNDLKEPVHAKILVVHPEEGVVFEAENHLLCFFQGYAQIIHWLCKLAGGTDPYETAKEWMKGEKVKYVYIDAELLAGVHCWENTLKNKLRFEHGFSKEQIFELFAQTDKEEPSLNGLKEVMRKNKI